VVEPAELVVQVVLEKGGRLGALPQAVQATQLVVAVVAALLAELALPRILATAEALSLGEAATALAHQGPRGAFHPAQSGYQPREVLVVRRREFHGSDLMRCPLRQLAVVEVPGAAQWAHVETSLALASLLGDIPSTSPHRKTSSHYVQR